VRPAQRGLRELSGAPDVGVDLLGQRVDLVVAGHHSTCWSPGDSLEIFSNGASSSIQIAAEHSPASVRWNGRQVIGNYDEQTKLVSLRRD